ncbi:hypothetical protein QYF36_015352 [Acer negundo]|nr:hypothetical protein QYF36_015352 [Acer negundo]
MSSQKQRLQSYIPNEAAGVARAGTEEAVTVTVEDPVAEEEERGRVLRVGVICGGPSAERGISLNSARSVIDQIQSPTTPTTTRWQLEVDDGATGRQLEVNNGATVQQLEVDDGATIRQLEVNDGVTGRQLEVEDCVRVVDPRNRVLINLIHFIFQGNLVFSQLGFVFIFMWV